MDIFNDGLDILYGRKKTNKELLVEKRRKLELSASKLKLNARSCDEEIAKKKYEIKKLIMLGEITTAEVRSAQVAALLSKKASLEKLRSYTEQLCSKLESVDTQKFMLETMKESSAALHQMNADMNPVDIDKIVQDFENESSIHEEAYEETFTGMSEVFDNSKGQGGGNATELADQARLIMRECGFEGIDLSSMPNSGGSKSKAKNDNNNVILTDEDRLRNARIGTAITVDGQAKNL